VHVAFGEADDVSLREGCGRVVREKQDSGSALCDPHRFRRRVPMPGVHWTRVDDDPRGRDARGSQILGKQQLVQRDARVGIGT
jgi:hypothetical protein